MFKQINISGLLFLIFSISLLSQCKSTFTKTERLALASDLQNERVMKKINPFKRVCEKPEFYSPTPYNGYDQHVRYVKVNFHIMNIPAKTMNFLKSGGRKYVKQLIKQSNARLMANRKMLLPEGNSTPVLPINYQYVLTGDPDNPEDDGIYFHFDEELGYYNKKDRKRNLFVHDHYEKYGVQKGEVLNIFLLEHHPDSILSKTYKASSQGIGTSNWAKLIGCKWFNETVMYYDKEKQMNITKGPWHRAGLMNHELGHSLGLSHTWNTSDGCDDTPKNPNCWNKTNKAPCDTEASNNVMDYNMQQFAFTPCQLGIVHAGFMGEKRNTRRFLVKDWCEQTYLQNFTVRRGDSIVWSCHKDLKGGIILKENAKMVLLCRTSLPAGAEIVLYPGSELILHNAQLTNSCGKEWNGIRIIETDDPSYTKARIKTFGKTRFEYCPTCPEINN